MSDNLSLEKKKAVDALLLVEKVENRILELIVKKSSLDKIIRIVAYIVRFIKNCKTQKVKRNKTVQIPVIDVEERETAFLKIVQIIQSDEFTDEIYELEKEKALKNNRIQKLNPFLQKYDVGFLNIKLLRVGGRLSQNRHILYRYISETYIYRTVTLKKICYYQCRVKKSG